MGMNEMAERAFRNALERGKVLGLYMDHDETVTGLAEEFNEFILASEFQKSPHIPDVTHAVEELTDILITCMTELYRRDINVEKMVLAKIEFNENRDK